MPYASKDDLPDQVRDSLPSHAQDIYKEAFNSAHEQYGEEQIAHKVAWSAVKKGYEKSEDGRWHAK